MAITNPPALQSFSKTQINLFLQAKSQGLQDDIALFKAGLKQSSLSDLLATISAIDPHAVQEAAIRAKLPLVAVKQRLNSIMERANDAEDPMSPELALDILERREPDEWGKRQTISIKPPEPKLPPEEHSRLARLFALPEHAPIEGVVIQQHHNADRSQESGTLAADSDPPAALGAVPPQ
jgi:hypothetical protein